MRITYKGKNIDFKDLFYTYAKDKEGYRNSVYKDVKGYDTIGIGHLVTGKEPFTVSRGKTYSDDQIQQLFDIDYDELNIAPYVKEIADAGYSYNMMLAVAHFIWGHGLGDYPRSLLRINLLNKSWTKQKLFDYLESTWDIHSPTNQRVNREDFTVAFSREPWEPGYVFETVDGFARIFPAISDFVKEHKAAITGLLMLTFFALILLFVIKLYKF